MVLGIAFLLQGVLTAGTFDDEERHGGDVLLLLLVGEVQDTISNVHRGTVVVLLARAVSIEHSDIVFHFCLSASIHAKWM